MPGDHPGFTVASVLCALSWSAGSLVAFRGIQGLGGALLAPAGLSLLMTTFAEGRDRNVALGIWGAASGSGGAVGVLLGGVLTSYLSWPWIFFINAPVGVALLVSLLTLFSMIRIWMGAFWSPPERGAEPVVRSTGRAGGPALMVAPTVVLVLCSLGVAVAAGPIYSLSERTARDLLDRGAYIDEVLGP